MPVRELHVKGYRSIRDLRLKLKRINVLVGPNGCGKSNLYRSMMLLSAAATGRFATILAKEGGMASVLWAGRNHKHEKPRLLLEVTMKGISYSLECGRVPISERPENLACFSNDPDIKVEEVKQLSKGRPPVSLVKRVKGGISARNMDGRLLQYPLAVQGNESVLSGLRDPQKFPELALLREEFLNWRFYHHFRTDIASPLRQPQVGVMTPVLSDDGLDVAAALATINAVGDSTALSEAIDDAFPGSKLRIDSNAGEFTLTLQMPGFNRSFDGLEISDGTLQYLCLVAALLSPRPPALLALNEPETSIHPDLSEALAKLIVQASKRSQMWITTHSYELAKFIAIHGGNEAVELEKRRGATCVRGDGLIEIDDEEEEEPDGDFLDPDQAEEDELPEGIADELDDDEDDDDDY
ncbi:MAG TPA: AAA family ATPase [Oculatellaceae cyanobacterium]